MSSWSAKVLAVRRVTQDNQGKRTAGTDGVASLEPHERLTLVASLDLDAKPKPVRRVWIPKPGTDEQRPLGIPTMHDRALQALVKLALEPEWEAKFEPNSYGFRPGRSCQDAIDAIYMSIKQKAKYALDADIAKCFDRINQEALLDKLNTFPLLRRILKAWLKAGVLDGDTLFPAETGTPQGGVISPLLANIALHGLEEAITSALPKTGRVEGRRVPGTPTVVRYADDFVVLHPDREVIRRCKEVAQEWLQGMGLELKPSKTSICHTLLPYREDAMGQVVRPETGSGEAGFDFLGFTIRQFPVGQYHSGKGTRGKPLGFKTIIKPSKDKVKLHRRQLAERIARLRGVPQKDLIGALNPVIKGWCNYYRHVVSKTTFAKADEVLFTMLRRWAFRRHPNKGRCWVVRKYWRRPSWVFGPPDGFPLASHSSTKIVRHVKVQGGRSLFDGDWAYWVSRMGYYPGISPRLALLLKGQGGKCGYCGLYFTPDALIETHHRDRDRRNNQRGNLEALHRHCHDAVHGSKGAEPKGGIRDRDQLSEEPCERETLTHGSEGQPGGRPPG
jgi:RNA-directed DNA polymerase